MVTQVEPLALRMRALDASAFSNADLHSSLACRNLWSPSSDEAACKPVELLADFRLAMRLLVSATVVVIATVTVTHVESLVTWVRALDATTSASVGPHSSLVCQRLDPACDPAKA